MNDISERIKKLRIERNLSQQELAELSGMKSRSTINKIEKGTRGVRIETATKIAKALNVDPDYLVFGDTEEKKDKILEMFNRLGEKEQDAVLALIQSLIGGNGGQ